MPKQLKGQEFLDPKFFDQFQQGARESLVLINEIKDTLTTQIQSNSSKLNLITPDSLQNIKKANQLIAESTKNIQQLEVVQRKEVQTQQEVEAASKKATAQRQKEQKQYERNRIAEDRLNKARIRAFDKYERALQREQKALQKGASLYAKVQAKVNSLILTYNEIATKKELGLKLSKKEEIQLASLEKRLTKYQNVLKRTDANIGKHQRNVGNYKSTFDGLGFSIAQLSREAPAFANSMQTGFMAISNNIPMLVDEINKLKVANRALAESGKPTVSIFKKLGSAIFGWQTLISIGVTLLTVYGAELVEFIKGTDESAEAQERLNEKKEEAAQIEDSLNDKLATQISKLSVLFDRIKKSEKGSKDRASAMKEVNKQYNITLENLDNEQQFLTQINKAYEGILTQMKLRIALQMHEEKLTQSIREELNIENKIREKGLKTANELMQEQIDKNKELEESGVYGDASINLGVTLKQNEAYQERLGLDRDLIQVQIRQRELLGDIADTYEKIDVTNTEDKHEENAKAIKKEVDAYKELYIEIAKQEQLEKAKKGHEKDAKEKQAEIDKELDDELNAEIAKQEQSEKAEKGHLETMRELQEKGAKERADNLRTIAQRTTDFYKAQTDERIRQIDREVDASKRRADTLKAIAANSNLDAKESIAIEERNQDKATLEKEKQIKKQKQIEASLAMLKTYTSALEKTGDSKQAISEVLKNGTLLAGLINALPSFDVGTDNTSKHISGGGLDGKGGFLAINHPNEKIFNAKDSAKIGFDIPNSEVADIIQMHHKGMFSSSTSPNVFINNKALELKLDEVNKSIQGLEIPSYDTTFDKTSGTLKEIVTYKNKTKRTERRVGIW